MATAVRELGKRAATTIIKVRVLGVNVPASTASGHPMGAPWAGLHPARNPIVEFSIDDPLELVSRLAAGDDLTVDVSPMRVITWNRPAI